MNQSMFREFVDTSFSDYRQVRVVLQELPLNPSHRSSFDFQRFCTSLFHHKHFTHDQFKLEYCFLRESPTIAEAPLGELQLFRRPFAFVLFTICHSSEQLRLVLEQFSTIKQQQRDKNAYVHLFVRYKSTDTSNDSEPSSEDLLLNEASDESDYVRFPHPSISSLASLESQRSFQQPLSPLKLQQSLSVDDNESITSDSNSNSLSNSFNPGDLFREIPSDEVQEGDKEVASASIVTIAQPNGQAQSSKRLPSTNLFDLYDGELTRALHRVEKSLAKHVPEPKRIDVTTSAIDSQLADIRLMVETENDCSLLETQETRRGDYSKDRLFKEALIEFDLRIMRTLFEHYLNASNLLGIETGKNRLSKKLLDARTLKRKGDCCLLLGSPDKAYQDYRRAAEALKSQNDPLWHAAALEARIAASYSMIQKSKRSIQSSGSLIRQHSLARKFSVDKILNRIHTPLEMQAKFQMALQLYSSASRLMFNKLEFRLELDACIRWCALLMEQGGAKKHRNDIDLFIKRISSLGAYLERNIDNVYLNAFLAEAFACIGMKRKSAWHARSAVYSCLILLNEEDGYHSEMTFFGELIKRARIGYGIDDNRLLFPLVQKTIIIESIQFSAKENNYTTIIENVHFALELLIDHMNDTELETLLTFLNTANECIRCSYCHIPRLRSLDLFPLSVQLQAWKAEPKNHIFIYHATRTLPNQKQSLHRKVDFLWVKNEKGQIALVVDNYLPATMTLERLEFITNNPLSTEPETKYIIPARTTKRLLIDCIPKEPGQLRIQGLRYHVWSTDQEFRFTDFPSLRQCSCSIDVVDELPILNIQSVVVNNTQIELIDKSTLFTAQIHQGEELFVALDLMNASPDCNIDILEMQVFASGYNMTEYIRILDFDLPIPVGKTIRPKIDLSRLYERCLSRQDRSTSNTEHLFLEIRLNYSNECSDTNGYYRRCTIELQIDYLPSVTFEISNIQADESDLSYLICGTVENHLSEAITFQNHTIPPLSESSLSPIKQDKIKLHLFPSSLTQLISDIRTQLLTHMHYSTATSNKHLCLPLDWQHFSNENIQHHLHDLVQTPYSCDWHFKRLSNTLHVRLCIISQYYKLERVEFVFLPSNGIRFLNSNKMTFIDVEPGKYFLTERILVLSQEKQTDVLVVDVIINGITWKSLVLNYE